MFNEDKYQHSRYHTIMKIVVLHWKNIIQQSTHAKWFAKEPGQLGLSSPLWRRVLVYSWEASIFYLVWADSLNAPASHLGFRFIAIKAEVVWGLGPQGMSSHGARMSEHPHLKLRAALKTEGCHDANFVITGGTWGCHYDNLQCHQRW